LKRKSGHLDVKLGFEKEKVGYFVFWHKVLVREF